MLSAALGAVIALLALVAVLLHAAGRARARALADDVRARIEPYIRRKAAEAGLPAAAPTWTRRSHPEEIVSYSCGLARRLLDRERQGVHHGGDTLEYARTQPADAELPAGASPASGAAPAAGVEPQVETNDLRPPRR
jgi:hypothetical protein